MTALDILDVLARATALLALAALVDALLRRRGSAAARHLVWVLAMAGLLALPIVGAVLPHWTVAIPVAPQPVVPVETADGPTASAASKPAQRSPAIESPRPDISVVRWTTLAVAVYAAGLVMLLVRILIQTIALRRLSRAAPAITDGAWRRIQHRAMQQLHIGGVVRLLQATDEIVPIAFGTWWPTIVVPASAEGWPDERRRAVLLHELAHVARRDCLAQLIGAVACAIYWPHPGVWWAARRLRIERELACDDRVLMAGTEPNEYAGHLLEIAHSLGKSPAPATALAMARAQELENRLLAVLDAARNRAALPRSRGAIALVSGIALLLPLAVLRAAITPVERVAARTAQVPPDSTGTWELRLSSDGASAHLTMRTAHASYRVILPTTRLESQAGMRIAGAVGPVHVPIRRDAGMFTVEGVCRGGVCGGTWTFGPDARFAAELASRGIGRPTPAEQLQLAMSDVGFAFLEEVAKDGYAKPDVQMLVRATQHGVGTEYVRGMASLGYRLGTLDALVRLVDHGVDPEYVRGMSANGLQRLSADDLVRARDHGVDPAYVNGMRRLGFGSLDLAGLITARDHGIDPAFADGLAALGYRDVPLEGLLEARDHGVDPDYIRRMRDLGYRATLHGLGQMRGHGIDPEYVGGLAALGYRGLTLETLIRMRDHGVDPDYVRGLAATGYTGLPLEMLMKLRDHGVDPEYVRRVKGNRIGSLTPDQLIARRDRGADDPRLAAQEMLSALQSWWRSLASRFRG